ncbi:MAG TPA: hypothetical protein VD908_08500 [Cytophagales bacterium]|nr:hypothetical protein [Cytophagales bacterium]
MKFLKIILFFQIAILLLLLMFYSQLKVENDFLGEKIEIFRKKYKNPAEANNRKLKECAAIARQLEREVEERRKIPKKEEN